MTDQEELERRQRFAKLVRELIERLDETQEEFALRFDMTSQNLNYWIGSKRNSTARIDPLKITGDRLDLLADLLNWSTAELKEFIRTGEKPPFRQAISLVTAVSRAPLAELEQAVVIAVRRLAEAAKATKDTQESYAILDTSSNKYREINIGKEIDMSVGWMIAGGLETGGGFVQATGLTEKRLKELVSNPSLATDAELQAIANALFTCKVTKQLWTVEELRDLIRTTRRPTGQA